MAEKNVIIIVKSSPYTTLNSYEALRVAIGLWEHTVKVLWTGDGIYNLLKNADHTRTSQFHADFPELDIETYADSITLGKRGIDSTDLIEGVQIANEKMVTELLLDAEATLVF